MFACAVEYLSVHGAPLSLTRPISQTALQKREKLWNSAAPKRPPGGTTLKSVAPVSLAADLTGSATGNVGLTCRTAAAL
jgi:hypothetical protein